MRLDRRRTLGLLGSAVAMPFVLRPDDAQAALKIVKLGNPIQLGANQPGGKSKVGLAAFPNDQGGFIAAWINTRSTTDARAFVRKYRSNGAPASVPIQMGGASGPTDGIPAINVAPLAFPDGTSLIFFAAARNGAKPAHEYDIFVQRMSASFQKVGDPTQINTRVVGLQSAVLATLLTNGKVQAVWESLHTNFGSSLIRGRLLGGNGQPLGPERTVITHTDGFNTPRSLVRMAGGGSVLSYTRIVPPAPSPVRADGASAGESEVWKVIQQLNALGELDNNPIVLDSSPVSRQFGAADLYYSYSGQGGVVYASYFDAPASGNNAPLRVKAFDEDLIPLFTRNLGKFTVEPGYQFSPQICVYRRDNINRAFISLGGFPDVSLKGIVARLNSGTIEAGPTEIGSTGDTFLTNEAMQWIMPNGPFFDGYSTGNTATDSKSFVQPLDVL